MTLPPLTRQTVLPLLKLSGTVLEAQWNRVGHITVSDRCRGPVGQEIQKRPRCLIFGSRTTRELAGRIKPNSLEPIKPIEKSCRARSHEMKQAHPNLPAKATDGGPKMF